MTVQQDITRLAAQTTSAAGFEHQALALCRSYFEADVGALIPASRPDSAQLQGFDHLAEQLTTHWAQYSQEVCPVQAQAHRLGVASDLEVLGRTLHRTRVYREVMAPLGGRESVFVVPTFRGQPVGVLMLGTCGRSLSKAARRVLADLASPLAVSWAASQLGDVLTHGAACPQPDPLTMTEQELLSYLQLGYTTREIALARSTSFYTVRNQLSQLYRKLGVANRTEAVGRTGRTSG